MTKFSFLNRKETWSQLNEEQLDLIVIGGGITGAGIALDATARGLSVALFEKQDFAAGTSSRSTKLIHGGLRYLKQFEIKVVAEVGQERAIVYENGPHVTTPEWMLLPLYKKGSFGKWSTALGLTVYDFLARVKRNERKKMLSVEEVLQKEPLIKQSDLIGGGYYVEYRTDDARLTIEVMKRAVEQGANAFNYSSIKKLLYSETYKVIGVEVEDVWTGETHQVFAKKVINATGPWVDDIREMDHSKTGKTLKLTKGVHIVFDQSKFPLQQAVYFDTPDGRMCFAIPRGAKTYFGTTDTAYDGDKDNPLMTKDDELYLLNAANYIFPSLNLSTNDIESSYAGLRPLIHQEGKKESEISRKDEVFVSPSGLISIAGGKLTGYRKMAEDVVAKTLTLLRQEQYKVVTKDINTKLITISGGDVGGSSQFEDFVEKTLLLYSGKEIDVLIVESLTRKYGSNIHKVMTNFEKAKEWEKQYGLDLETGLSLAYGITEEMVVTVEDFLIRRTGLMLFDIDKARKLVEPVSQVLASVFNWNEIELTHHKQMMLQRIQETRTDK